MYLTVTDFLTLFRTQLAEEYEHVKDISSTLASFKASIESMLKIARVLYGGHNALTCYHGY